MANETASIIPLMQKRVKSNEYVEDYDYNFSRDMLIEILRNTEHILENQSITKEKCLDEVLVEHNNDIDSIILENSELSEELVIMNIKLRDAIPIHSLIYICVTSLILGSSITIFILQLIGKLSIASINFTIAIMIGSAGLGLTAISAIKDWKEFLNGEKKQS